MLDFRFLDFCREDSLFYDAPDHDGAADQDFHAGRIPGPGWTVTRGREWTVCTPPDLDIPEQGWKIHVSASPDNAADLLDTVAPYCAERGLMYKYISNQEILGRRGSKYGDRSASGKFITIYPPNDTALERTLNELEDLVGGTPAPYILSDLRWNEGPLFVRYGGFVLMMARAANGALVPGIRNPDGDMVPDVRRPAFRPPEWVTLPDFLATAHAQRKQATLKDFPFRVYKALHFSNGGGVYRALDKRTDTEVLLKEARPLAGLDASGDDAVTRMEREHWALAKLAGLPTVPTVVDYRDGHEHRFLAREFVEGEPLIDVLRARHPFNSTDNTPESRAAYTRWALHILDQVTDGVAAMHDRGVVFGDLHPGNILVKDDDTIAFIDMETSTAVEDNRPQAMGALGFHAPHHLTGAAIDLFALNVLRLTMFVPMPQIVPWGVAKVRTLLEAATEHFDLPADFVARIEEGLGPQVLTAERNLSGSWTAAPDAAVRDTIARSILDVATPERHDRLYPGDAMQFLAPDGGLTFAYGAAGVLWALDRAGYEVPESHVQWLVDHSRDADTDGPGFFTGLAGIAYTLDHLGRTDEATALMNRAFATPTAGVGASLANGWAGLGLTALHLARRRGEQPYLDMARTLANRVSDLEDSTTGPKRVGLVHGRAGHALFLLRLFEHTGQVRHLDAAVAELRADLNTIDLDEPDSRQRLGPGLVGSAGLALVTRAIIQHRPEADLTKAHRQLLDTVQTHFAVPCGLFNGRSGTLFALLDHDTHRISDHLDALRWEAMAIEPGRIDFLGDNGYRLSTDLATGSCGVLLALSALDDGSDPLPFLPTRVPSGPGTSKIAAAA
ncbi:class III lanthionine synthetase LanKC [Streptomyces sp. TRM66268-LWL]|uniref:Class III lanthionine synthetase LanKC n=1 Tax=Streptomyces polyasparticus TaxID=2767826 RepID=A0ABR7STS0_9ACTN|nr:class III lanthionine synthetase LanKC [Streptomyces polyasparticus]MBC9718875.1 class III lanthionine synthetase LanKC [Streptomyces polyasparticus]